MGTPAGRQAGAAMTGKKGKESQRQWNKHYNLVRRGIVKPREYTDTLEEAWMKAGL
jgi:hypothetical protein